MKMYKVAQSVPPGYVEVEITINDDGTASNKIVGYGADADCNAVDHKKLVRDVLSKPVPGFHGPLIDVDAEGLTPDGLAAKQKKQKTKAAPMETEEAPFGGSPKVKTPSRQRATIDTGYGV